MVRAQLWFRRGRTLATLAALVIAVASFALLTSAARGAQVRAVGTVRENFRPGYDILVRPPAAATDAPGELISFDRIGSTYGGISVEQWRRIERLPGVDVAAPVAMVGYVMHSTVYPVDLAPYVRPGVAHQVFRVRPTWVSDNGLSRAPDGNAYLYVTTDRLEWVPGEEMAVNQIYHELPRESAIHRIVPGGGDTVICVPETHYIGVDPLDPQRRRSVSCWSSDPASTANATARPRVGIVVPVPMLMAAVDPEQEARLNGLDTAVTAGSYLTTGAPSAPGAVPVLVAGRPQLDRRAQVGVERLDVTVAERVAAGVTLDNLIDPFEAAAGTPAGAATFTEQDVYAQVVDELRNASPLGWYNSNPTTVIVGGARPDDRTWSIPTNPGVQNYWTVGPAPTPMATVPLDGDEWGQGCFDLPACNALPVELSDPVTRGVDPHGNGKAAPFGSAYLQGVGVFDPAKVDVGPALAGMPADLYSPTGRPGADASSRKALGGQPLGPSANFAGPVPQHPSLLTTLDALPALHRAPYQNLDAAHGVNDQAPISTVRVRVAGEVGMDDLSRERVRAVAQRIHDETGLRVDLTLGASPAGVATTLPAGNHGRPPLTIAEPWLRTGVATTVVAAIDHKSLLLAVLVLVACVLAVGNAAGAAVRTRSTELAVLACIGWPRRRLFALVCAESAAIALLAAVAGVLLAFAAAWPLGVRIEWLTALGAVPAALALTLGAALVPARRAARADPATAVRPPVVAVRRRRTPRSLAGLAWTNLLRAPGRTVMGALSLAIGVAALTLLAVVTIAFRGAVTGTVLGDAITVQVQSTDYIAAALTTLLGAVAVADVLYVNIRERSAEFALLGATGWSEARVTRLAAYEAVALGIAGGVGGAGAGLGAAAALTGSLPPAVYATAAGAALAGALLTTAAAAVPLRMLRGLPMARLLAED
ncbi:FtsX-like permease family protein [Dactylosporangium sp. NPDC000555]|uniref:FtsX-like permease family protein n=1 Tax=Dactylosporangium sp. NPDC000555 TaxID=3154260 RepID=UPI00331B5560